MAFRLSASTQWLGCRSSLGCGVAAARRRLNRPQRSATSTSTPSYLAVAEPQSFRKVLSLLPRDL